MEIWTDLGFYMKLLGGSVPIRRQLLSLPVLTWDPLVVLTTPVVFAGINLSYP